MRINNSDARCFVENRQMFRGSNLHGTQLKGCYVVYSYDWYPIFVYVEETEQWWENQDGYSVSTKRHISQCRPYDRSKKSHIHLGNTELLQEIIKQCAKQL